MPPLPLPDGVVFLELAKNKPTEFAELADSTATFLSVHTASVEKAHLKAQESKPARSRGRALTCPELSEAVYRRSQVEFGRRVLAVAEHDVFKRKHGVKKASVGRMVSWHRADRPMRSVLKKRKSLFKTGPRKTTAYHVFRRNSLNSLPAGGVGTTAAKAQEATIARRWQ